MFVELLELVLRVVLPAASVEVVARVLLVRLAAAGDAAGLQGFPRMWLWTRASVPMILFFTSAIVFLVRLFFLPPLLFLSLS